MSTASQGESSTGILRRLIRLQPTFTLDYAMDLDEALHRIHAVVNEESHPERIELAGNCMELSVEPSQQRFWSPHLSVQLQRSTSGVQVFGRFSPRPEVWTMFMAVYAVVTFLLFACAIYGYAQWFLGARPWAWALIPFGLLGILLLHLISQTGQRLSEDQIATLRARLQNVLSAAMREPSSR